MRLRGKQYDMEHIIHLIREIDYLRTQIQPHDTGHIHTTINTLESRVEELMRKKEDMPFKFELTQQDYDVDSYGCNQSERGGIGRRNGLKIRRL